jgi:hypothetical protein
MSPLKVIPLLPAIALVVTVSGVARAQEGLILVGQTYQPHYNTYQYNQHQYNVQRYNNNNNVHNNNVHNYNVHNYNVHNYNVHQYNQRRRH